MKASVSSWSYRALFSSGEMGLLKFVDEVKGLGADGLEIFRPHVSAGDQAGQLKAVASAARKAKLEVSAVTANNNFAAPTAAGRAAEVERVKQLIADAAAAGIKRVNTFTGNHTAGEDPFMEASRVIDAYREVVAAAEEKGVELCLENHSSVNPDADGILAIISAVGSRNLRTNPDPTNFVPGFAERSEHARELIYSETAKIAPLAGNAHLKIGDFTGSGEHTYVDVGRLSEIYRMAKYNGHVVLEVYKDPEDAAELCAKGLALLRRNM